MLVLSGGTSKGAGDVSHRIIARLGKPGIIAHGVALKPGKPLCLAVCDGKPVVILPGFPTSAMFTFHDMIVPVLRRMAGLPPRSDAKVTAKVPVRIASNSAAPNSSWCRWSKATDGLIAYPSGKGSGAITSFAQADGFLRIDALADQMPAGTETEVTLFTPHVRVPDLVIVGSHCTGLDLVTAPLARSGPRWCVRSRSAASADWRRPGAANAISRRSICSTRTPKATTRRFSLTDLNWCRAGGGCRASCFDRATARFEGLRRAGCGARRARRPRLHHGQPQPGRGHPHPDRPAARRVGPDGYWNQPSSHNAVAAAVAQHRADWGMTIAPVAHAAGLGFIPFAEEHYDFALVTARKQRPAVQAFLEALASERRPRALAQAGFRPA